MKRINWVNTIFLIVTPILVLTLLPIHISLEGVPTSLLILFVISCLATSVSITGGYHRLFAHKSYEANRFVKLLYLICGAAALQGSALKWCSDHRRHHRHVDTEEDPYNVKKGFWFAHIGWVFMKDNPKYEKQRAPDLKADPLVLWQHKHYILLAVLVGFLLPTLIGSLYGYPWGGLLYGGFARVVITHHCTFFINSLCHLWGKQPYGDKVSAKDNFLLAFFTYGEGFHNFHHKFANDYRNGIRWYHWDPTKWTIRSLSFLGFTWNLQKTGETDILKARLSADELLLQKKGRYDQQVKALKLKIEEAHRRFQSAKEKYRALKADFSHQKEIKLQELKLEIKNAKMEFQAGLTQWQAFCRAYPSKF